MSIDKLRESFERWAKSTEDESIYFPSLTFFGGVCDNRYNDVAWQAFQEAYRLTLNSLCVGADVTPQGAQIALMSKIGDVTTLLASGYTEVNSDGFVRVLL